MSQTPQVAPHASASAGQAIAAAAAALEAGQLVAFPTETVYGLGADAENPQAVAAIYAAKGRPQDHPVIVHIASGVATSGVATSGLAASGLATPGSALDYWADQIPEQARQLAAAFWPGPLTMILKRNPHIVDAVSGGQDTVGLRCPSHPVALALLAAFKGGRGGIAAPSANKFGQVSPTTAGHVCDEFAGEIGLGQPIAAVLDGGSSAVGIESTILDLSRLATHGPVLLRPGHISAQQIADVIGVLPSAPDQAAPRASGTLESHYAPHTPVAMADSDALRRTLAQLDAHGHRVALIAWSLPAGAGPCRHLPAEPAGYAHGLYAALRDMDQTGSELILVEAPPQDEAWLGVNDRLRRAAFGSTGVLERILGA